MPEDGALDPDPDGCQLNALKEHLLKNQAIKYVFVECAPPFRLLPVDVVLASSGRLLCLGSTR